MGLCLRALLVSTVVFCIAAAASDRGFSGTWKLNAAQSDVRSLPKPPDQVLKVEQSSNALKISGDAAAAVNYPLDGKPEKYRAGDSTLNTVTKWEGDALLVNTLVSGPQSYTIMERWVRSRDGSRLTIKRTIVRNTGESESVLVYENPDVVVAAKTPEPAPAPQGMAVRSWKAVDAPAASDADYVLEAGTRVLLRLINAVNTKTAAVGDRVYLETSVPVFVSGHLILPRGTYVTGTVTETKQAGRVKGKSALNIRFDSVTLPNGVTRDLRSHPSEADAQGNLDRKEGRIEGQGDKGGDARKIGETTAAGTGIGALAGAAAGHIGMGAGIGAAAGAAAGLGRVLGTRGPDVVLQPGTSMELTLDRDLHFAASEVR
ncbi:MAG: hypothetical protein ABSH09_31200 [Bryobacteraceae bacterium]|jgi:type IV secretion system protein VirB10